MYAVKLTIALLEWCTHGFPSSDINQTLRWNKKKIEEALSCSRRSEYTNGISSHRPKCIEMLCSFRDSISVTLREKLRVLSFDASLRNFFFAQNPSDFRDARD